MKAMLKASPAFPRRVYRLLNQASRGLLMNRFLALPGRTHYLFRRVRRRLLMYAYRPLFAEHGRNFRFDPDGYFTFENIHVGDNVNLGSKVMLMAQFSTIRIGSNVMFGPEVSLIGGGHSIVQKGIFMNGVEHKLPGEDLGIQVEDDVWVGHRATILRGVTVGRGSVIGAGSVVRRDVPPYAIAAGVPARVIRFRFDVDTILEHERSLYPPEKRLARDFLLECRAKWQSERTPETELHGKDQSPAYL
jgi:acetyltransferase-like isoleucine patch superfamily enzyme